jgi:hypothetical protein
MSPFAELAAAAMEFAAAAQLKDTTANVPLKLRASDDLKRAAAKWYAATTAAPRGPNPCARETDEDREQRNADLRDAGRGHLVGGGR